MAETELTKEIKQAIRGYSPLMQSNMRTVRWAEEVDVGTGYVDSIRFEDYIKSKKHDNFCGKRPNANKPKELCSGVVSENCKGCVWFTRGIINELGIATTCYEIKITKSDFKSNHGHNFVGNFNYYVIPKELYTQVKDLVPDNIGIILYHGHGCLKRIKKCEFKEINQEDLSRYLYNALKKWVDK